MKEAYCSLEVAKLLKEKGFDEPCSKFYKFGSDELFKGTTLCNSQLKGAEIYNACTHQMACAWLREVHNKYCDVGYDIDLKWFFQIIDLKETVEYDYPETKYYHAENSTEFNSYEEAVEAAIKYCLENLI